MFRSGSCSSTRASLLWRKRRDFRVIATSEPASPPSEFIEFVGWQSQERLPEVYAECDVCVVPTIVQDGLSRTSVEAMAAGRPVVASRIGGLPFTVSDGETGLLCEPGNPADFAKKIQSLLDDPARRVAMGRAGRSRFEEAFTWDRVIPKQYVPLLGAPIKADT